MGVGQAGGCQIIRRLRVNRFDRLGNRLSRIDAGNAAAINGREIAGGSAQGS